MSVFAQLRTFLVPGEKRKPSALYRLLNRGTSVIANAKQP